MDRDPRVRAYIVPASVYHGGYYAAVRGRGWHRSRTQHCDTLEEAREALAQLRFVATAFYPIDVVSCE